jgi:hypothetical protein
MLFVKPDMVEKEGCQVKAPLAPLHPGRQSNKISMTSSVVPFSFQQHPIAGMLSYPLIPP